jgi:DnaJ-like protein
LSTYYDILRVPEHAEDKEIKAAYRQAALAYHPDHIPKGVSKRMREDAAQTWLEIQEAFAVLSDPAKREEYDTLLEEMRQSEEAEQQFEPPIAPPEPPKPEASPPPTPPQTVPQSAPQAQATVRSKIRRAWLWFCFQAGRHWRELCLAVAAVLFVSSGIRDPEAWSVMSIGIVFTGIMASFAIVVASGPSWKDKRRYLLNALPVIAFFIAGITYMSIPPSAPVSKAAAMGNEGPTLTSDVLSNMTYRLAYADRGGLVDVVKLVNSEERSGGGFWQLDKEHIAFGDLDGDGVEDAVVVLGESGGGSGFFSKLVAVIRRNGRLETPAVSELGDRIKINQVAIRDGIVTVDMITQGPNDPLCCPTERQVRKLAVRGNRFVPVQ